MCNEEEELRFSAIYPTHQHTGFSQDSMVDSMLSQQLVWQHFSGAFHQLKIGKYKKNIFDFTNVACIKF